MKKIAVHDGKFHADEILAVALLDVFLKENFDVTRVGHDEVEFDNYDFVIDVGLHYDRVKYFDHHQNAKGTPAACFMVWEYLKYRLSLEQYGYTEIDELVKYCSENDVGNNMAIVGSLPYIVGLYNNENIYSPKQHVAFLNVLTLVTSIIGAMKEMQDKINCENAVVDSLSIDECGILWLPCYLHAMKRINGFTRPEVKYIAWYESEKQQWYLRVPNTGDGSYNLVSDPLQSSELATFVHASGFLATFKTEENIKKYFKEFLCKTI